MFPATPLPDDAGVRVPVEATLRPGWRYDAKRRAFVSDDGDEFRPANDLPAGSQIVYKVPAPKGSKRQALSAAERDLQRYLQVILPAGESASDYVETVRRWPSLEGASVGPTVSLP